MRDNRGLQASIGRVYHSVKQRLHQMQPLELSFVRRAAPVVTREVVGPVRATSNRQPGVGRSRMTSPTDRLMVCKTLTFDVSHFRNTNPKLLT